MIPSLAAPGIRGRALVAVLLAAMAAQALLGMAVLNATYDETTHLPSGYTYLRTGDFRLNPQHPPLIKLLAAAPLLALDPALDLEDPGWQADPPDEWGFGQRFLYAGDADALLFWGRLPIVLLALLMALYVHLWARDLFGARAGLLALFLCAFSPTVIAHGRLVTMDVGLATFSTMTLYHLWRFTRGRRPGQLAAAGLCLGLALAAKFSGLVLLPACALLLGVDAVWPPRARPRRTLARVGRAGLAGVALLALAMVVVQASYFFSADPWIYWRGVARVQQDHTAGYAYYLMGDFAPGGWWYYFLAAFLFKTPVPTLILLALAVMRFRRHRAESVLDELFLVVPALLFLGVTSAKADNLGVRYLLPLYPLVFVFASRMALAVSGRASRLAAVGLGAWYLVSTTVIFPDQLAYFNEAVGGPSQGHRLLDDSNIDWGQDLKRLKLYMTDHGIDAIRLRYGGHGSPAYYGIRALPVSNADWSGKPPPGLYAMSTHLLIRGEYFARTKGLATDWLSRYEPIGRIGYSLYLFRFE